MEVVEHSKLHYTEKKLGQIAQIPLIFCEFVEMPLVKFKLLKYPCDHASAILLQRPCSSAGPPCSSDHSHDAGAKGNCRHCSIRSCTVFYHLFYVVVEEDVDGVVLQ